MQNNIEEPESAIDLASLLQWHMPREENSLSPQLSLLPEILPPPEDGMKPEHTKNRDKKARHENEGPIKNWLSLRVVMGCMRKPLNEVYIRPGMAFPTGLHQTGIGGE
jgi:hypothetical protein